MSSPTSTARPTGRMKRSRLRPLGLLGKLRLVAEVLAIYPRALRLVRTNDLPTMMATARDVERVGHDEPRELEHELAVRLGVAVQRTLTLLPTDSRCLVRS